MAARRRSLSPEGERIFRGRRWPRPTQFDYLHLRILRDDIAEAFGRLIAPGDDVLDVYCGTRPYDDLLPVGVSCLGFDIEDRYGVADVVSSDFLPFENGSFDAVVSIEAFHYVADPARGVAELRRVLRPDGRVVIAVPLVWEYDRQSHEHRYTEATLRDCFEGWRDVEVHENGGRAVAWTTLTGRILDVVEAKLTHKLGMRLFWRAAAVAAYLMLNAAGSVLERRARLDADRYVLPMNLMLTARRPADE